LSGVDATTFRAAIPYPWLALDGLLKDQAHARLRAGLPPLALMQESFGRKRAHGQRPHDRYLLEYRPDLPVASEWHTLVAELESEPYRTWLARLLGTPRFRLGFHWHYTPAGCSVSPHCDARHKLGSHIFYFNSKADWDPTWGGETLILDDGGRLRRNSAPDFDVFDSAAGTPAFGNRSLIFRRRGNSWHGVRPLRCPEGWLRKVFIVVIHRDDLIGRLRRRSKAARAR
jgi:hypothetical protein